MAHFSMAAKRKGRRADAVHVGRAALSLPQRTVLYWPYVLCFFGETAAARQRRYPCKGPSLALRGECARGCPATCSH